MSGNDKYLDKPGTGKFFIAQEDRKEDFSGYIVARNDIKAGEKIPIFGYKKVAESGRTYTSLFQLDKREEDL